MSLLSPGRNIVLIGLMGAGKTTVGGLVAAALDRPFVDTDDAVEGRAGRTVAALFAAEGERGFRAREAEEIRRVAATRGQVVAVGGGAVLDPANVTQLRSTGDLLLLDARPETLAARIADDAAGPERPLLSDPHRTTDPTRSDPTTRLADLRALRDAAYRSAATHAVDTTGLTPEEVAARVLEWARAAPGLLTRDERPT